MASWTIQWLDHHPLWALPRLPTGWPLGISVPGVLVVLLHTYLLTALLQFLSRPEETPAEA